MTTGRVLIDASNLHAGGGVQVAASLLNELARLRLDPAFVATYPWLTSVVLEASPAVVAELDDLGLAQPMVVLRRRPTYLRAWLPRVSHFDVSFVVFGPEYGWRRARRRIIGFADVTSVYPRPRGVPPGSSGRRIKALVRGYLSRRLLRGADRVVVETTALDMAIRRAIPDLRSPIDVVPNCVNAILPAEKIGALVADASELGGPGPRLLYVARAYPHKNHDLLGLVGQELEARGVPVVFAVTLTPTEWGARSDAFRAHADNLGALGVKDLAAEYGRADAVIFPSLLEAFSATPLEGLSLGKLVFASDRDFVRSICGTAVLYFDPLDPVFCADLIETWWSHRSEIEEIQSRKASQLVAELPGPADRARAYVGLIDEELRGLGDS